MCIYIYTCILESSARLARALGPGPWCGSPLGPVRALPSGAGGAYPLRPGRGPSLGHWKGSSLGP